MRILISLAFALVVFSPPAALSGQTTSVGGERSPVAEMWESIIAWCQPMQFCLLTKSHEPCAEAEAAFQRMSALVDEAVQCCGEQIEDATELAEFLMFVEKQYGGIMRLDYPTVSSLAAKGSPVRVDHFGHEYLLSSHGEVPLYVHLLGVQARFEIELEKLTKEGT